MGILEGRVALVTGASSGIGRACALRYAREGASVVGCARRGDKLTELVTEIEAHGGVGMGITCDVASREDIEAVVAAAVDRFGRIDILGNFAQGGLGDPAPLDQVTPERATDFFATGPLQSMLFMQRCMPSMKEHGYGRIINTASHAFVTGAPGFADYAMAKGAIVGLTRVASREWGPFGIVVNTVFPVVKTEPYLMTPKLRDAADNMATRIPVRRFGDPYDDCAPILVFLASESAGYLNGQSIAIDGGMQILA